MSRRALLLIIAVAVAAMVVSPAALAQETTIRLTGWSAWIGDAWLPAVQDKLAEHGIRVEFEYIPSGQYVDKILTQTAGGVPPDLMQDLPYRYTLQRAGWNGIHRDLTPFLEQEPEFRSRFVPAIWGLYEYFDGGVDFAGGYLSVPHLLQPQPLPGSRYGVSRWHLALGYGS